MLNVPDTVHWGCRLVVCASFPGLVLEAADSAACVALVPVNTPYDKDSVHNCSLDTYLILSMSSMKKSMESTASTRRSTTDPHQLMRVFASQQY